MFLEDSLKKIFLLILLFCITAELNAFAMLELAGAPGDINPLAARAGGNTAAQSFFNSSKLADLNDSLSIGFMLFVPNMNISLMDKDPKYDVPTSIGYASSPNESPLWNNSSSYVPLSTQSVENLTPRGSKQSQETVPYITIGAVTHIYKKDLAVGFFAMLPASNVVSISPHYVDEREQYFTNSLHYELYEDALTYPFISVAVSYRLNEAVSMGFGMMIGGKAFVNADVYVPEATHQEIILVGPDVDFRADFYPHFAFQLTPINNLSLSATLQLTSLIKADTTVGMIVNGMQDENGNQKVTDTSLLIQAAYQPLKTSLNGSYKIDLEDASSISFMISLLYSRWSDYSNRFGEKPLDTWYDTVSVSFGSRLDLIERSFGFDLSYVPTPVPDQYGRTNYVDNDRLGMNFSWQEYFQLKKYSLTLGINAGMTYLFKRSVKKYPMAKNPVIDELPDYAIDFRTGEIMTDAAGLQTNNPGYPGFSSSGFAVNTGISITMEF